MAILLNLMLKRLEDHLNLVVVELGLKRPFWHLRPLLKVPVDLTGAERLPKRNLEAEVLEDPVLLEEPEPPLLSLRAQLRATEELHPHRGC